MYRTRTQAILLSCLLLTTLLSSCDPSSCGCAPPPAPHVTAAQLLHKWQQSELQIGTPSVVVRDNDIKNRYAIEFRTDGTYTQTLLADNSTYTGTWMLMEPDNRMLHLTDQKGDIQEYTIISVSDQTLVYSRPNKAGQQEYYSFKLVY
ncbi:lipocalin-like domain-containing protein [Hymenobacter jejuensis]|uniref:Lipocalin family protein n=1 Tax=Hymenobacter jejuensis TaxID=2502781 RepID=A0A5B7ZVY7_9BACT|nr:lipocalin family protein [Hymenobacter jejuensis]QDA59138.1 lipocalin family protein [Hymenobacter jejuensis]